MPVNRMAEAALIEVAAQRLSEAREKLEEGGEALIGALAIIRAFRPDLQKALFSDEGQEKIEGVMRAVEGNVARDILFALVLENGCKRFLESAPDEPTAKKPAGTEEATK